MRSLRHLSVLIPCLWLCCLLAGCAAERGAILDGDPHDYTDASFLEVPDDEYFWLAAPPAGRHMAEPQEQQVPKQGIWLKAGWINVESQCFSPRKAKHEPAYPIFPEYADATPLYIEPERHYLLSCDLYKMGVFNLTEMSRLQQR